PQEVYDGNDSTFITRANTNSKIQVDESLSGSQINVVWSSGRYGASILEFYNSNDTLIGSVTSAQYPSMITIPSGTMWIKFVAGHGEGSQFGRLNEFEIVNDPNFEVTNGYMVLHIDPTKSVRNPYQMITINYHPTSEQKLYRIG